MKTKDLRMVCVWVVILVIGIMILQGCNTRGEKPTLILNPPPDQNPNIIEKKEPPLFVLNTELMQKAFKEMEAIGEGRNFITVKVDLPQEIPHDYMMYALVLDKHRIPIRKITGFMVRPEIREKNHVWFYLFLYAPGGWINTLPKDDISGKYHSAFIQFIVQRDTVRYMEENVPWNKTWGDESATLIADVPMPPGEVLGVLELRDYTFFAKGDIRAPEGYFIEGAVIGSEGEWGSFFPSSDILGEEPKTELNMVSSRGWLELSNGKSHAMQEAVAPLKPYVEGWWDGKGWFHPNTLTINR